MLKRGEEGRERSCTEKVLIESRPWLCWFLCGEWPLCPPRYTVGLP